MALRCVPVAVGPCWSGTCRDRKCRALRDSGVTESGAHSEHERVMTRMPGVCREDHAAGGMRSRNAWPSSARGVGSRCVRPTSGTGRIACRSRTRGKGKATGGAPRRRRQAPTAVAGSRGRYAARPWRSRHTVSTCADARACRGRGSGHRGCRRRDGQERRTRARSADAVRRCRAVALSRCRAVALSRCRAVALSRCRAVALSRCRAVALSRCRAVALSRCRAVALNYTGTASSRCQARFPSAPRALEPARDSRMGSSRVN